MKRLSPYCVDCHTRYTHSQWHHPTSPQLWLQTLPKFPKLPHIPHIPHTNFRFFFFDKFCRIFWYNFVVFEFIRKWTTNFGTKFAGLLMQCFRPKDWVAKDFGLLLLLWALKAHDGVSLRDLRSKSWQSILLSYWGFTPKYLLNWEIFRYAQYDKVSHRQRKGKRSQWQVKSVCALRFSQWQPKTKIPFG